jgi:asparagine synthase (glutamine-hydrolysing)
VPSFDAASEELRALLVESVRLRLRSDVPLGAFLSGGVDSTSVVALMRLSGIEHVRTFSIGFEDERFNELSYAAQAASHLGTEHHARVVTGTDALALADLVSGYDEPFADSSAIPTYFVSRLAREHVTVSLSGDGGDELFGGYSQYPAIRRFSRLLRIPAALRKPLSLLGSALLPEGRRGAGFVRRLGSNPDDAFLNLETRSLSGLLAGALSPAFMAFLANDRQPSNAGWEAAFRSVRTVSDAQLVDQRYYLPDDILVKVDRASMAVSLEGRVPLLDHRLADFVNSLPESFKLAANGGKRILKAVMAREVPPGFFDRPKKGFGVPLRTWLTGPLSPVVCGVFRDNAARLFAPAGAEALLQAMRDGKRDLSAEVWALFVLGLWAQNEAGTRPS